MNLLSQLDGANVAVQRPDADSRVMRTLGYSR
jgi:hypothetical protein